MRILPELTGIAALAAALAAWPAEAAQGREPWERAGPWEIRVLGPGACTASRRFPSQTRVSLMITDRGHSELFVSNPSWSVFAPGNYRMRLIVDGKPWSVAPAREGRVYNSGQTIWVAPDFASRLAAASALEIDRPDGSPADRLDLGGVKSAVDRLGACVAESARAGTGFDWPRSVPGPPAPPPPPPPPPWGKATPTRARANLATYFSPDDYPAAAFRAREEGKVGFRLLVERTGRVAACTVISTSGSAALDSTTCSLLVRRARFVPARDSKGRPTADSVRGRIVWKLPPLPPPPPAPPPPLP